MCPLFCCKTYSRRCRHSKMPNTSKTFRHASLPINSPTSTTFNAVQADRGPSLSFHTAPVDFRDRTGRDFRDPTRPTTLLLNQPVDRKKCRLLTGGLTGKITTFRSDNATRNRKNSSIGHTTVMLIKCELSLHYRLSVN